MTIQNQYLKKCIAFVMALLIVFPLLIVNVAAENSCQQTILAEYDDKPVEGIAIKAYRIAVLSGHSFSMEEPFQNDPIKEIPSDVEAWNALAETFQGYCYEAGIAADISGKTDQEGKFQLSGLPGLYLIAATGLRTNGYLYSAPFFIYLSEANGAEDSCARMKFYHQPPHEEDFEYRKVLKIWDDAGHEAERPESIEITLCCDGAKYDSVTLNAACNWRYTWKLPTAHTWSVSEAPSAGYTQTVDLQGITFTVTNTFSQPPVPSIPPIGKLPQTGLCWWPVPMLAIIGIVFLILAVLRREKERYEA